MGKTEVVILNWNGEEHLKRFLGSVVSNTPPDAGITVADNGSTDGSVRYVRENYPTVKIIALDRNYGFTKGYNMALRQIDADNFVLLNSDVETPSGWLEPLIERLDSDEKVAAVSPKLLSFTERSRFEYAGACGGYIDILGYPFCRGRVLSSVEYDRGQYDSAKEVFWTSGACMLIRRDRFNEMGGFDEKFFAHMEEIDLCWRLQLAGYKLIVEPRSSVYHLGGGTLSATNPHKTYLNYRNNLAMLYKNLSKSRRWWILTVRTLLDWLSVGVNLAAGKVSYAKAIVSARRDFRRWKPELKSDRPTGKITLPATIYRGSILLRYLFCSRKFGRMMSRLLPVGE